MKKYFGKAGETFFSANIHIIEYFCITVLQNPTQKGCRVMFMREEIEDWERQQLSPFAMVSADSQGRSRPEELDGLRTCFMRDRDRIIHSKAFRRLSQKTQVYITPSGDHYRTRLTHTLEVNQIAKTIGKALRLNEDLIEAIALAHDVGHTPFAHTGEEVLNQLMPGGFRHNVNSVRVLERIERHKGRPGLNLSREVLDGVLHHSGYGTAQKGAATLEGQIIRFSDKIAYVQHDIDDSIRAGVLREEDLPRQFTEVLGHSHGERITTLVTDLVQHTRTLMEEAAPGASLELCFTSEVDEALKGLRAFMFDHVYKGDICALERERAALVVQYLFDYYCNHPEQMPQLYQQIAAEETIKQGVCDYLSGMSDAYCIAAFKEITIPRSFIHN